uniref:Response regulator n=1 Tax=Macrostomum lignano TaxID=282301 RepID=A0A1I8FJG8_9PLAT
VAQSGSSGDEATTERQQRRLSPGSSQSSSQLITESVSVLVSVTASATGADASEDHRTRDDPVQFDPLGVILIDTEATLADARVSIDSLRQDLFGALMTVE